MLVHLSLFLNPSPEQCGMSCIKLLDVLCVLSSRLRPHLIVESLDHKSGIPQTGTSGDISNLTIMQQIAGRKLSLVLGLSSAQYFGKARTEILYNSSNTTVVTLRKFGTMLRMRQGKTADGTQKLAADGSKDLYTLQT
eukprot:5171383-Amphidinium_carterae.1